MTKKLLLPEGFSVFELGDVYNNGGYSRCEQILESCASCVRRNSCRLNKDLKSAVKYDYSYASDRFVKIYLSSQNNIQDNILTFESSVTKALCLDYKSPQLRLPGIPRTFSDGVERIVKIMRLEMAELDALPKDPELEFFFMPISSISQ